MIGEQQSQIAATMGRIADDPSRIRDTVDKLAEGIASHARPRLQVFFDKLSANLSISRSWPRARGAGYAGQQSSLAFTALHDASGPRTEFCSYPSIDCRSRRNRRAEVKLSQLLTAP